MCMLSYFPAKVQPVYSHLANGAETNTDGYGYAIVVPATAKRPARIITRRYMDAAEAIADFSTERAKHDRGPAMFHSRWSTGGVIGTYNCHPFAVGSTTPGQDHDPLTVVGHNGVLFTPEAGEKRSDTRIWAEDVFPYMYRRLDRVGVRGELQRRLGTGNKILVLTANPRYEHHAYLFGETLGHWVSGAWHSNQGYLEDKWPTYRTYSTSSGSQYFYDCAYCQDIAVAMGMCTTCHMCNWCDNPEADCECSKSKPCRDCGRHFTHKDTCKFPGEVRSWQTSDAGTVIKTRPARAYKTFDRTTYGLCDECRLWHKTDGDCPNREATAAINNRMSKALVPVKALGPEV